MHNCILLHSKALKIITTFNYVPEQFRIKFYHEPRPTTSFPKQTMQDLENKKVMKVPSNVLYYDINRSLKDLV